MTMTIHKPLHPVRNGYKWRWFAACVSCLFFLSVFLFSGTPKEKKFSTGVPSSSNNSDLETAFYNEGKFFKTKNDYLAALDSYFNALTYSAKLEKNKSGYIYLDIHEIFKMLNYGELSKNYLKKALDFSNNYKDEELKIRVLNAYGNLYYEEENYERASLYIDRSLKTEEKRSQYICAIPSLYLKASILLAKNKKMYGGNGNVRNPTAKQRINARHTEAIQLLKKAVDMSLGLKQYNNLLPVISEYIELEINSGNFKNASFYLDKIDEIYAPYYRYYFFYYYLKALYFEKKGKTFSALRFYRETASALSKYRADSNASSYTEFQEKIAGIYSGLIRFYLNMYNTSSNSLYLKNAIFFSEMKNDYSYDYVTVNSRDYKFLDKERTRLEKDFLQLNSKYIGLLSGGEEKSGLHSYEKKLKSYRNQLDELSELSRESPLVYKHYTYKDLDLKLIQSNLTQNRVIIKYVIIEEAIYAYIIGNRFIRIIRLKGNASTILRDVKRLTAPLEDFSREQVDFLRIRYDLKLAEKLYNILLKDAIGFTTPGSELVIIPDRELFRIPFDALVTGFKRISPRPGVFFSEYETAEYLVENYSISYAYSLFHLKAKSRNYNGNRFKVVGFGAPTISSSGVHNNGFDLTGSGTEAGIFKELPSAEKELNVIPLIWGTKETRIFLHNAFNRYNFEENAGQADIVHIATHFIINRHYPLYSALLFSAVKGSNPLYYAYEIFGLKLNADLVILSACESSESHLLGVQGLRGMTAAFMHSGTQAMIVGLWSVDEHSSALLPLFYQEYRKPDQGLNYSRALRNARLTLLRYTADLGNGIHISYSHPVVWANYMLYYFKGTGN